MRDEVMQYFGLTKPFNQAGYYETDHHKGLIKDICGAIHEGKLIAVSGMKDGFDPSAARDARSREKSDGFKILGYRKAQHQAQHIHCRALLRSVERQKIEHPKARGEARTRLARTGAEEQTHCRSLR